MAERTRDGGEGGGVKSRWEWVAAAVSTALVLAVVGYLLYDAVGRPRTPPAVVVAADGVLHSGGVWLVEFRATNRGYETAAAVRIEGELMRGDSAVETSEAVLDYVPGRSVRYGGLFFRNDPRAYRLELRALGYQEP
ncbi:MAG TPA: TIGR02588 family protein [Longimicrobium sp.]|nr:TIGR02588 family protein [Longimicrobium sp.]